MTDRFWVFVLVILVFAAAMFSLADTANVAVEAHYEQLATDRQTMALQAQIAARRQAAGTAAGPGSASTGYLLYCLPLLTALLAGALLLGQGGLVGLVDSSTKLVRAIKRSRGTRPAAGAPARAIAQLPPAPQVRVLTSDPENVRWIESGE